MRAMRRTFCIELYLANCDLCLFRFTNGEMCLLDAIVSEAAFPSRSMEAMKVGFLIAMLSRYASRTDQRKGACRAVYVFCFFHWNVDPEV